MNARRAVWALCVTLGALPAFADEPESVLRVCSDPQNLPFSNQAGEGFENRIAQELARDLGRSKVEYAWFPQRMGFVRNTLRRKDETTGQYACDVIIGVPAGYELTATTRPYMHSTYSLVHAGRPDLDVLGTADDLLKLPAEQLQKLRIGVFARSPGADWLLRNHLLAHAVIFPAQSGDPSVNPASVIGQQLAAGNIDLAIVWGPIAGYLAREHATSTPWHVIPFAHDPQIRFEFPIAMGVRFGEKEWKDTLDRWIADHADKIQAILREYRVPLAQGPGCCAGPGGS